MKSNDNQYRRKTVAEIAAKFKGADVEQDYASLSRETSKKFPSSDTIGESSQLGGVKSEPPKIPSKPQSLRGSYNKFGSISGMNGTASYPSDIFIIFQCGSFASAPEAFRSYPERK